MRFIHALLVLMLCAGACAGAERRAMLLAKKAPAGGTPPIGLRSFSTNDYSGTSSATPAPAGIVAGDGLVAIHCSDSVHAVTGAPSGWVEVENNTLAQSGMSVWTKLADGTEGSTITFPFTASEQGVTIIACYTNVASSFFDGDAVTTDAPGIGVAHTTAALLPSQNRCLLSGVLYKDPATTVIFTEVPGYALRAHAVRTGAGAIALFDKLQTTATSEGLQVIESEGSTWAGYTFSTR